MTLDEHFESTVNKDIVRMRDAYCKYACHKNKMCEYCSIPLSKDIIGQLIQQARRDN